ncbi:MAG: hypothetical protein R3F59_22305 [Myxococcota bacterium]
MRRLLVLAVTLVGLVLASGAQAKDAKKGKKEDTGIILTGVSSFDKVFTRVDNIDGRLTKSEKQVRTSRTNLNTALGVKRNAPVSTALTQLRNQAEGKVRLAVDDKAMPKLELTDAVPPNVQKAVDALNAMTANYSTTLTELTGLKPEIEKLVQSTRKMPANLKNEFSKDNAGLLDQVFKLPKTAKALKQDITVTKGLTGRTTALTKECTTVLGLVKNEFAPSGRGGHANGGGARR